LKEQLEEKHIGAIFNMLAKEGRILPHFPVEELDNNLKTYTKKNLKVNYSSFTDHLLALQLANDYYIYHVGWVCVFLR
jgi:hypothetical protein